MEKIYIIPCACEFYLERGEGKPGPETHARLVKAMSLTRMQRKEYRILLGAGKIRGFPSPVTAKSVMKEWITWHLINNGAERRFSSDDTALFTEEEKQFLIKTSRMPAWGTFREMESIMESFGDMMGDDMIIVVSSDYHIPRLRLIWWFFDKEVSFVSIPVEQKLVDKVLEPLRFLKVLLLGIGRMFRNLSLEPRTAA